MMKVVSIQMHIFPNPYCMCVLRENQILLFSSIWIEQQTMVLYQPNGRPFRIRISRPIWRCHWVHKRSKRPVWPGVLYRAPYNRYGAFLTVNDHIQRDNYLQCVMKKQTEENRFFFLTKNLYIFLIFASVIMINDFIFLPFKLPNFVYTQ